MFKLQNIFCFSNWTLHKYSFHYFYICFKNLFIITLYHYNLLKIYFKRKFLNINALFFVPLLLKFYLHHLKQMVPNWNFQNFVKSYKNIPLRISHINTSFNLFYILFSNWVSKQSIQISLFKKGKEKKTQILNSKQKQYSKNLPPRHQFAQPNCCN